MCAQCATHSLCRPALLPTLPESIAREALTVARVLARRLPRSAVVNDAPESPLRAQRWDDSGVTACPARSRGMPSSMGASAQRTRATRVVVLSCLPGVLRAGLHSIARERPPGHAHAGCVPIGGIGPRAWHFTLPARPIAGLEPAAAACHAAAVSGLACVIVCSDYLLRFLECSLEYSACTRTVLRR